MTVLIDFSFYNGNFIFPLIGIIESETTIKNIKYSENFEWKEIERIEQLDSIKFNELNFETEAFGLVYFQVLENALPRVFAPGVSLINMEKFIELIEKEFSELICFGKICESVDSVLQNVETPDSWRRKKRELPNYVEVFPNPVYTNEREKELVSLESLPGHYHIMSYDEKLWFGSCWQMYFSPVYFKFIPEFLFDEFTDCFENKVFESGLRKIVLFQSPEDYDLPESRAKQWSFRKATGMDSIAHELTKHNNRIGPKDLPVVITKNNCKKGTTSVILFKKDKTIHREFLDDGISLVLEDVKPA